MRWNCGDVNLRRQSQSGRFTRSPPGGAAPIATTAAPTLARSLLRGRMPTLSGFQIAILGMDATPPAGLPELDVRRRAEATMTQRPGPVGSSLAGTCECFVASSPGQQFRVQVRNNSALNACASLYVDGEWIYSGLSYGPKHRLIYFSGKLLDESTVQQMHFVDTDTTCTLYCRGLVDGR